MVRVFATAQGSHLKMEIGSVPIAQQRIISLVSSEVSPLCYPFITEFHCQYGNLSLRNNENWSGELCGGVVRCKDGITTVTKCPNIPPKPDDCAKPRLIVKHQKGKCCRMKWKCKGRKCLISHLELFFFKPNPCANLFK